MYSTIDAAFEKLPEKIKSVRLRHAMSQAQFAARIGATQRNVSNWERGSKPAIGAINNMAQFAGETTEEFLGLVQDRID